MHPDPGQGDNQSRHTFQFHNGGIASLTCFCFNPMMVAHYAVKSSAKLAMPGKIRLQSFVNTHAFDSLRHGFASSRQM